MEIKKMSAVGLTFFLHIYSFVFLLYITLPFLLRLFKLHSRNTQLIVPFPPVLRD